MATISERLRNDVCLTSSLDWQAHVALAREAADTIDALAAALETVASDEGYVQLSDDTWFAVRTAIAQARKGGG